MKNALALEMGPDGQMIGRDPRVLQQEELRQIGHQPMSAQEALRLRCVDCCAGNLSEVRKCTAVACPSWPFRMGKSPWKEKRVLSDEHKAKLAAARGKRSMRPK